MEKKPEDVEATDRVLIGFTWYTVTKVEGNVVYAKTDGRAPHKFNRATIREVWSA